MTIIMISVKITAHSGVGGYIAHDEILLPNLAVLLISSTHVIIHVHTLY